MEIKDLEQLLELLRKSDVTEFELHKEGVQLKLSRASIVEGSAGARSLVAPEISPAIVGTPSNAAPPPVEAIPSNYVKVESPIVGTFYRKPSPDSEVFVQQGDVVKKGETLCIIEAMKLMNEIPAPASGKIEKICLADGQVVEFGEVLFLINPDA